MAVPPGGPMEVVFSFDTTGSMGEAVIGEVKAKVSHIAQRLQADIPGIKIGVIAHGDYCDLSQYVIRVLPLTDSLADVVTFINDTEGTWGGDFPECYELALRRAREMPWTPSSKRVLVVIGDAYPHEADYPSNTENIDWKEELKCLVADAVTIYGVHVYQDSKSKKFFQTLATASGGQYLSLKDMTTSITQVIMGICYREQGAEMFHHFETGLKGDNEGTVPTDIDIVIGTLRPESSLTDRDTSEENVAKSIVPQNDSDTKTVHVTPTTKAKNTTSKKEKAKKKPRARSVMKTGKMLAGKTKPSTSKRTKTGSESKRLDRPRREYMTTKVFPFAHLPWSQWHVAAVPSRHFCTAGKWTTSLRGKTGSLWRKDLLQVCCKTLKKSTGNNLTVFELGIMDKSGSSIKSVAFKATRANKKLSKGVFGLPWYYGLFKAFRSRIYESARNARLFLRWSHLDDPAVVKNIPREIDYAFNSDRELLL